MNYSNDTLMSLVVIKNIPIKSLIVTLSNDRAHSSLPVIFMRFNVMLYGYSVRYGKVLNISSLHVLF